MNTPQISCPAPGRSPSATDSHDGMAAEAAIQERARTIALAGRLKALADPTRLRMLDLLAEKPEALCVCDITSQFDLHQPTISHHLRILREEGLIRGEKRGVWSYFWLTDEGKRSLSLLRTLM